MLRKYIVDALKLMSKRFENIEKQITQCECYSNFNNIMNKSIKKKLDELLSSNKIQDIELGVHVAQGRAAYIPWFGFHYIKDSVDSNPQTGIYITILFKADGSGLALSLQNGTENFNQKQICEKTADLKLKYKIFINKANTFSKNKLDLKGKFSKKTMSRCEKYEKANILGKEYNEEQLKRNDCTLETDLIYLIDLYKNMLDISSEECYQDMNTYVSPNRYKQLYNEIPQKRKKQMIIKNKVNNKNESNKVTRNEIQGKIALKKANFKCEYDSNHITFLNENNDQFMHKHHLIQMEYYFDFENNIDDHNNIYSLCPTCHSQIHHGKSEDQKVLIETLFKKRKRIYEEYYNIGIEKLFDLYGINK